MEVYFFLGILNSDIDFRKIGSTMGVPLGGIGSGSIGRGWRGDFSRFVFLDEITII